MAEEESRRSSSRGCSEGRIPRFYQFELPFCRIRINRRAIADCNFNAGILLHCKAQKHRMFISLWFAVVWRWRRSRRWGELPLRRARVRWLKGSLESKLELGTFGDSVQLSSARTAFSRQEAARFLLLSTAKAKKTLFSLSNKFPRNPSETQLLLEYKLLYLPCK